MSKFRKYFPIKTETACRLKWSWSTLLINEGRTGSCHRASMSQIPLDDFDNFHNTPSKISAREAMLKGIWPGDGCEYCRDIEESGGHSDRQFQLTVPNVYPDELEQDLTATHVTPAILEVFFSNTCNFKCVYCRAGLSSAIYAEEKKFGGSIGGGFSDSNDPLPPTLYKDYIPKFWDWFKRNGHQLKRMQILGGEPLLQKDFIDLLEYFDRNPMPQLEFNIVTNLHLPEKIFNQVIDKFVSLIKHQKLRRIDIQISIDCWGPTQEYVRYGFDRTTFDKNIKTLLSTGVFRVGLLSTVCSLTIHEMPELIEKYQEWNKIHRVHWYPHLVLPHGNTLFTPTIFDYSVFETSFDTVINMLSSNSFDEDQSLKLITGIAAELKQLSKPNVEQQKNLLQCMEEIDRRRNLNWRSVFPWLTKELNNVV